MIEQSEKLKIGFNSIWMEIQQEQVQNTFTRE